MGAHVVTDEASVLGINDRAQLAALERTVQRRRADRTDAGRSVDRRSGAHRHPRQSRLRAGCDDRRRLRVRGHGPARRRRVASAPIACCATSPSGRGTRVEAFSHIEAAAIGRELPRSAPTRGCVPGTNLADDVHIGNFVEVKASTLGGRHARPTTSPTSATPASARASTIGAGTHHRATTTARTSTAPSSATTSTSARTACWSRRSPSARGATIGGGSTVIARTRPRAAHRGAGTAGIDRRWQRPR